MVSTPIAHRSSASTDPGGTTPHPLELPFGRHVRLRHVRTGTRAAAWAVVTLATWRSALWRERLDGLPDWHRKADGNCAVDYGFHQILGGVDEDALKAMTYLVDHEGVTSFKLFMAYPGVFYSDDGQILRALQTASENGAMIMMHAENGIAIDVLVGQALARGETDPKYHGLTRPSILEGEATHRAIVLAEAAGNVPLYIVHMSASEALDAVAAARHEGANVFAETCPQYLYMTLEDHLARPGFEGAKFVCSPPIRSKHDKRHHHADLWKGLRITSWRSCLPTIALLLKDHKEWARQLVAKIPNGVVVSSTDESHLPGRGQR